MKKRTIVSAITVLIFSVVFFCFNGPVQAESLNWSGVIEVDLRGADRGFDEPEGARNSKSDIVLDTLELLLEAEMSENVSAMALVKYEGGEGDDSMFLDEANLTLSGVGGTPLNITAGKWVLPFGVFESHLVNDPITQDKYEINASGISLAYAPAEVEGLELALTAYDETDSDDDVTDYILSASFAQEEMLRLNVYFNSAKMVDRNDTMGVSVNAAVQNLTLDLEYITALERAGGADAPEESAYSVSAAYMVLPALELAARYEGYDDDTGQDDTFNDDTFEGLESTYSIGGSYELFENAALSAEYRVATFEIDDDYEEWVLRLSVEF